MDQNKRRTIEALRELIQIDSEHDSNYKTIVYQLEFKIMSASLYVANSSFMNVIRMRIFNRETIDQKIINLIDEVIDYLDAAIVVSKLTEDEQPRTISAVIPNASVSYIVRDEFSIHPNFNAAHSSAYSMKSFLDKKGRSGWNVN